MDATFDLVDASRRLGTVGEGDAAAPARYRPNTAFIMRSMDKSRPELTDVADAVKQVFEQFDVRAVRADDIEHEDLITNRILSELRTAKFCFADLTGERPNVYYEVGYAHALGRRVILFRKAGTELHFDLAGYNCPEYENLRDLKEKLTWRLEHLTNRQPRADASLSAWKGQIDAHLDSSQIILLLISADSLASDYCYDVEMDGALARHDAGRDA